MGTRKSLLLPEFGKPCGREGGGLSFASLKFFRRSKWQAAFVVEQFLQPPVAGTAFAPDDFRRDKVAHFATKPPAFEPVFPTDGAFNRDAGDF